MAAAFYVKFWSMVIWLPPLLYLIYNRRVPTRVLVCVAVSSALLFMPFMGLAGAVKTSAATYLYGRGTVGPQTLVAATLIVVLAVLYQPYVLLAADSFRSRGSMNFTHIWYLTNMLFLFFPSLYEHHFLLTLPAGALVASKKLADLVQKGVKYFRLDSPAAKAVVALMLVLAYSQLLVLKTSRGVGYLPFDREAVEEVSDYVRDNTGPGDRIVADYNFYEYFSGRENIFKGDWHIWKRATPREFRDGVDEAELVVVTQSTHWDRSYLYPPDSLTYLNNRLCIRKQQRVSKTHNVTVYGTCDNQTQPPEQQIAKPSSSI